jgi:catechol 2,3-dioxygenase-like lactoylglutathione lyase family enzyme
VGIVVSDLNKALYFYQHLLGLKIVRQMNESGPYIDKVSGLKGVHVTTAKLAAGDGTLVELLRFNSHPHKTPGEKDMCEIGVSHVAFTVGNLDAEYTRLLGAGVRFNSPPQTSPDGYAKVAFCRDPDCSPIELVEVL